MLEFFDVDIDYADFLRRYEKKVPYIKYAQKDKFVCGVALCINDCDYFVPVSSNKNKTQTDIEIVDKYGVVLSTLRFGYMFPAPIGILTRKDIAAIRVTDYAYADLLQKEYEFCRKNELIIRQKAEKVYRIGCNKNHFLNRQCCDFRLLEEKRKEYFNILMDDAGI